MTDSGNTEQHKFTIVGAGLGGALMAVYLGKAGYEVEVYERRPDPRNGGVIGGRSINLAISERGINALRELGLADAIMQSAIPMRGRMIHSPTGQLSFQPYDRDPGRCINSISRAGLNVALISEADGLENVRMFFDHKCVDVDLDAAGVVLETGSSETPRRVSVASDVVIGSDGAFSAVRRTMQKLDRFDFSQTYLKHGYKELCIPPKSDGDFAMDANALHIWPRRSFMMIALPNADKTFTCTLFLAFEGEPSFAGLQTDADVEAFFKCQFPDAFTMMPTLLEDFRANPIGSLATMRCGPWHYRDKIVLLGDAAHAVVPFYGQGMNCTFEDCVELNRSIARHAPDWERTFRMYYLDRKPNADAIADLAIHNFIEMRDHAASRMFRMKKWWERTMHGFVPGFLPLYSMISFSLIPYAEAVARVRRRNRTAIALAGLVIFILLMIFGIALWPKNP